MRTGGRARSEVAALRAPPFRRQEVDPEQESLALQLSFHVQGEADVAELVLSPGGERILRLPVVAPHVIEKSTHGRTREPAAGVV